MKNWDFWPPPVGKTTLLQLSDDRLGYKIKLVFQKFRWSSFLKLSIVVMGQGQKSLTRVGSIFCLPGLGRVSHLWFGSGFGKFALKIPNFFPSGQKYLFGLGQRRVGLLFTLGQKYARVESIAQEICT